MSESDKSKLSLKQKYFLYLYGLRQYLYKIRHKTKIKVGKVLDSFIFYFALIGVFVFVLHKYLNKLNITISDDKLHSISFSIAGIIGASIAIIFSFSTFILQSTADLFSTQYLKKFIKDIKESIFFLLLVLLVLASIITPFFFHKYVFELLVAYLLVAFYLIYDLYRGARKRIDPETTIGKIKDEAINQLEKINAEFKVCADLQDKVFQYEKDEKNLTLDVLYKSNINWRLIVLENVKYLFEIGLRLLTKNEINSFNLTLRYIHDIYLKHLDLRNGHFMKMPASLWGSYSFDDEGFTAKILEYLQSMGDRLIQEKRKENIYFLLNIYESILKRSLDIKYADKRLNIEKDNPLFSLVFTYYTGFIERLINAKENDWLWESIKSVSVVSTITLQKTDSYFTCSQLNKIISKLSVACFTENQETFLKELVNIYFNQIKITWNRYENNSIFWKDLFKELKKSLLLLAASSNLNLSTSELFITFHSWQVNIINQIIELKDEKKQEEILDKFIKLMERWGDFLLDFARDTGLENIQTGLSIIQSVDNNLRILYGIIKKFGKEDFGSIYYTQFNTLSWYFKKTDKVEESTLFNLEEVLRILLNEIRSNFKTKLFGNERLIDLYIELIEQHFDKATLGFGYNHPRIIEKLVYLGLILHKYKETKQEEKVISKIKYLNRKYLELNKDYFELKRQGRNIMGPEETQLYKEIEELGDDLFSYGSDHLLDMRYILKQEIKKSEWEGFIKKFYEFIS